jgi:hypothetical protein
MASPEGLLECGFPLFYPDTVGHAQTQPFAAAWHLLGAEAVLCRSASVWRLEHRGWMGPHEEWSELAIFVDNVKVAPTLGRRWDRSDWLT